jgi:hypothetical protein
MKELNYNTLRTALDQLPQYDPPASNWLDLDQALNEESDLKFATSQLIQYEAPAEIWQAIESQLETTPNIQPFYLRFQRTLIWSAAATVTLLAVYMTLFRQTTTADIPLTADILTQQSSVAPIIPVDESAPYPKQLKAKQPIRRQTKPQEQETTLVVTSEAILNDTLNQAAQTIDMAGIELIRTLCHEQAPVCQTPEFITLKSELDDLTTAEESLRQAIGLYSDAPELIAQLASIERERNSILQQIIQLI